MPANDIGDDDHRRTPREAEYQPQRAINAAERRSAHDAADAAGDQHQDDQATRKTTMKLTGSTHSGAASQLRTIPRVARQGEECRRDRADPGADAQHFPHQPRAKASSPDTP